MSDKLEVYYFSPTGGTKKVSSIFADAMGKEVIWHDLGSKETMLEQPEGEMIVVAAPVFGGRIPSVVREKIEKFSGIGKKAVTIAVYGNRAKVCRSAPRRSRGMGCGKPLSEGKSTGYEADAESMAE